MYDLRDNTKTKLLTSSSISLISPSSGPLGGVKRRHISGCTKQTSIQLEAAKIREELTYFVDSILAGSCSSINRLVLGERSSHFPR